MRLVQAADRRDLRAQTSCTSPCSAPGCLPLPSKRPEAGTLRHGSFRQHVNQGGTGHAWGIFWMLELPGSVSQSPSSPIKRLTSSWSGFDGDLDSRDQVTGSSTLCQVQGLLTCTCYRLQGHASEHWRSSYADQLCLTAASPRPHAGTCKGGCSAYLSRPSPHPPLMLG